MSLKVAGTDGAGTAKNDGSEHIDNRREQQFPCVLIGRVLFENVVQELVSPLMVEGSARHEGKGTLTKELLGELGQDHDACIAEDGDASAESGSLSAHFRRADRLYPPFVLTLKALPSEGQGNRSDAGAREG